MGGPWQVRSFRFTKLAALVRSFLKDRGSSDKICNQQIVRSREGATNNKQ